MRSPVSMSDPQRAQQLAGAGFHDALGEEDGPRAGIAVELAGHGFALHGHLSGKPSWPGGGHQHSRPASQRQQR